MTSLSSIAAQEMQETHGNDTHAFQVSFFYKMASPSRALDKIQVETTVTK